MRRTVFALALCASLAGCTTTQTPGGHTQYGDPKFCSSSTPVCPLLLGAAAAGILVAVAH